MAMENLGTVRIGSTVHYAFPTFTKDQTALVAWSSGSCAWYVGASGQSAIFTGSTLSSPWNGLTGQHAISTVMSQANGFPASATPYVLRATAGTVDSTTITGTPLALVIVKNSEPDGAITRGSAASITAANITLASGHKVSTVGSVMIALENGSDATAKSRIARYSGSGDVFNVDPAWNAGGESLPASLPDYAVWALPPASTGSVPDVNVKFVNDVPILGNGSSSSFHV